MNERRYSMCLMLVGIVLFLAITPIPPVKVLPLTEERLKEALLNDRVAERVGFGLTEYLHKERPYSFRSSEERVLPTAFAKSFPIGLTWYRPPLRGMMGVSGPRPLLLDVPPDFAVKKIRRLIEKVLELKLIGMASLPLCKESRLGKPSPEAIPADQNIIGFAIGYHGTPDTVERLRICQSLSNPAIRSFYETYSIEVIDFTIAAFEKYPPEKLYPPELSGRSALGRILSDAEVKLIEQELALRAKKAAVQDKNTGQK